MIGINLFDNAFKHLAIDSGIYSITDNRTPKFIKYNRGNYEWDSITIFTDSYILSDVVDKVDSKYKVAWIIENRETNGNRVFDNIESIIDKFDFIITYDDELLNQYPDNTEFYPFGGCWVLDDNYGIYDKSKLVSMIYSHKTMTTGHKLRHQIANHITDMVDCYGSGCGVDFEYKEEILAPYKFSIVIENTKSDYYFTEKLLDCMAVGTIPIYWGANKIDKFFNVDGILTFNIIDELDDILSMLSDDLYNDMLPHAIDNLESVKLYDTQEDWIFENVFLKRGMIDNNINIDINTNDIRTYVDGNLQSEWLKLFFESGGDNMLYDIDNITDKSIIFDVGSYDGEYSYEMNKIYNCKTYGFEPVSDLYSKSNAKSNENIKFFNFALGSTTKNIDMVVSDNKSSVFLGTGELETVSQMNIIDVIDDLHLNHIDLIKLNIEGGEYDILNSLISNDKLSMFGNVLIQFHYYGDNPVYKRHKIISELSKTHDVVFSYPFVWELWRLK